jgi:hypothetical protein
MNRDQFENILDAQITRVRDVLVVKAAEYATEDHLANFKKVAHLRRVTLGQAITGMMAKHTVSIYDMAESGNDFALAVWDEKITDHINYLILLRAAIVETISQRSLNAEEDNYVREPVHQGTGD